MPVFWRYLLHQYLRVFFLACFSFVAILLVTRLDEIAGFAALGASRKPFFLFILYQIPYIIPIAVPISSLIAGVILFSRLSHTYELTALRTGGIALRNILAPVIIASAALSLVNFAITSELSTKAHLQGRKMVHDLIAINPIVLLQKAKISKLKGAYFQMDPIRSGEAAKDLLIVLRNPKNERLNLFVAKSVEMEDQSLKFENVSLITGIPTKQDEAFDNLVIENQKKGTTMASSFAKFLRKGGWKIANDHLKLAYLKIKMRDLKNELALSPPEQCQEIHKKLNKCYSDIVRRISLGISALTFTLLGAAFGIDIGRIVRKRGIILVFCLASLSLILFFVAKELDHNVWIASTLFLLPHALNIAISSWKFRRVVRGIE